MPIDYAAYRRKQEQLAQASSGGAQFWKPKQGDNKLRLLPYKDKKAGTFFFEETAVHYNLGDTKKIATDCLAQFGESCPICEAVRELKSRTDDKEAQELAQKLKATPTYYVPVLDYNDPQKKGTIQVWSASSGCIQEIIQYDCDPEWGDLADAQTGRVITVTKEPPSAKYRFGKYTCRPSPAHDVLSSSIVEEAAKLNLSSLVRHRSAGAVQCLLEGGTLEEAQAIDDANQAPPEAEEAVPATTDDNIPFDVPADVPAEEVAAQGNQEPEPTPVPVAPPSPVAVPKPAPVAAPRPAAPATVAPHAKAHVSAAVAKLMKKPVA